MFYAAGKVMFFPLSGEFEIDAAYGTYSAKCVSSTDVSVKILKKPLKNSTTVGHPPKCEHKYSVLGALGIRAMFREEIIKHLVYHTREINLILVLFSSDKIYRIGITQVALIQHCFWVLLLKDKHAFTSTLGLFHSSSKRYMMSAAHTAVAMQQVIRASDEPIFQCRSFWYSTGCDKSCWVEARFGCAAVL